MIKTYADASSAMPDAINSVITPAMSRLHKAPADDASVKAMPMDDPVPSHVQVRVKDKAPSDQTENCLGIVCL